MEVSGDEVGAALKAYEGFSQQVHAYAESRRNA
jgi:hypothetical protein